MANYLALIRKADFVDLYKYGSIHVNKDMTRQFTCKVEELPNKMAIFNDLTYFANAFDSTFTYLFIHYENTTGRVNDINIADLRGIYPLDNEAKTELSLSLDPRIKINDPLWPDAVFNLQKKQSIQDSKNGASNIWKIYNLSDPIESIGQIINDKILKEVVDELYDNSRPSGKLPIWVYIMRYERHAFYPPNTIGAFMDAVNAIFNYMAGREVDSAEIESTMIMKFLSYCNENIPTMQFAEILQKLSIQTEPNIVHFLTEVERIGTSVDLLKTAALFFIYRNRYKEDFRYEEPWEQVGKMYGKEFSLACYMLGCILGHEHTYDCMYEHLPLAIFKQVEPIKPIKKEEPKGEEIGKSTEEEVVVSQPEEVEIKDSSISDEQGKQPSLFPNNEMEEMAGGNRKLIKFPITLQKYTPSGKKSNAKNSQRSFNTPKEYQDFINSTKEDWRIIK